MGLFGCGCAALWFAVEPARLAPGLHPIEILMTHHRASTSIGVISPDCRDGFPLGGQANSIASRYILQSWAKRKRSTHTIPAELNLFERRADPQCAPAYRRAELQS